MIYKIVFFCIIVITILYLILKNKEVQEEKGEILGIVYSKYNQKILKSVKISLGKIRTDGVKQKFLVEKNLVTNTNELGEYGFSNIEIKTYWIMAEYENKKVLKMVKLTNENPKIEEVFLKF